MVFAFQSSGSLMSDVEPLLERRDGVQGSLVRGVLDGLYFRSGTGLRRFGFGRRGRRGLVDRGFRGRLRLDLGRRRRSGNSRDHRRRIRSLRRRSRR